MTIDEFCQSERISRSLFYIMHKEGWIVVQISAQARRDWQREREAAAAAGIRRGTTSDKTSSQSRSDRQPTFYPTRPGRCGFGRSDVTKGVNQPSRSPAQLKPAADATINEKIKFAYDAADNAGRKPPNIKELPAAVQSLLQEKGFWASGRKIQELGEAEEFKRRRRPPGKTVRSERPK